LARAIRDLEQAQLHAPAAVTQLGPDRTHDIRDLLHGAGQHPNAIPQQRTVGRMVDVALHYGGINAHAPARNDAVVMRYFHHPIMDLPEHLRPDRQPPSPHSLGIWHLPAAHSGEVAVHEVGAHLAFQGGIAQVPDVLEDPQT